MPAPAPVSPAPRLLAGWGRTAPSLASVARPAADAELAGLLARPPARGTIARGLGRSYGDAAQNAGGAVIDMTGLSGLRSFDPERGVATVQAGMSLGALIGLALPLGWFPAVTPGTRFVTVGGAIAADVHGKNHHRDGGFGRCVRSLDLLAATGERLTLTREGAPDRFAATIGGMGLTGVVLEATLQLRRVQTSRIRVDTERAGDLDELMALMESGDERYRYSVAWIDLLARGRRLGRSVLTRGDHAALDELPPAERGRALELRTGGAPSPPEWTPSGLVGRVGVRAFNEMWFRRAPRSELGRLQPLTAFFYPLDAIAHWNRLYGPRGFLQYQLVVPFGAEDALRAAVERLSAWRCPAFLAVLKRLGAEDGLISFPLPGWTLALDMGAGLPGLPGLLDELDLLVAEAGGRVYLAKDSRLRPELLQRMYPGLARWREVRGELDPAGVLRSDLARRLGLV